MATVESVLRRYYVNPGWVANYYGVPRLQVYRAIKRGRLKAIRVRGANGGGSLVLDVRQLPEDFPWGPRGDHHREEYVA